MRLENTLNTHAFIVMFFNNFYVIFM